MSQPKPAQAPASAAAPIQTPQSNSQLPTYISLFVAFIALIGTVATGYLQSKAAKEAAELNYRAAERSSDIKMGEIAVSILRAPITDEVAQIRGWAMDVIDNGNTRKFTAAERQALLKKPLPVVYYNFDFANSWLSRVPNPCSKFRKNPDGSWTQTSPVDIQGGAHGIHLEGNIFSGGGESAFLDLACK
jgi:hypothetical protein